MESVEGVVIRPAGTSDLAGMARVWWQLMSEHEVRDWDYWGLRPEPEACERFTEYLEKYLAEPDHRVVVAAAGAQTAGFGHGWILERPPIFRSGRIGRVVEPAVEREHRRQGIGRALLTELETWFRGQGLAGMDLMVDADNPDAKSLYFSQGLISRELHLVKRLK